MLLFFQDATAIQTQLPGLVTASVISVATIQSMKNSQRAWLSWINQHSSRVNKYVNFGFAFISALGLHYKFDSANGTLTITGLTIGALFSTVYHFSYDSAQSWAFNWVCYQLIKGRAADVVAIAELPKRTKPVLATSPGVVAEAEEMRESGVFKKGELK